MATKRLPTDAELEVAMERVRKGRNPARYPAETLPSEAEVPDFLVRFSLEVEQATSRCIAAFREWREETGQTPLAKRRQPKTAQELVHSAVSEGIRRSHV